jgi:hypothetical protein
LSKAVEKTKEQIVEELKRTLLKDIELQEQLRKTYKLILRRVSTIYIALAVIAISLMSSVIYLLTRPAPATEVSIKTVDDWNKIIMAQRKFIQYDREDIATAREQLMTLLKIQDSLKKGPVNSKTK